MPTPNPYLKRFAISAPQIQQPPVPDTGIIVVIPCYNEPNALATLDALWQCQRPPQHVELLLVINASPKDPPAIHQQNQQTLTQAQAWQRTHQDDAFTLHILYQPEMPPKHAGVGLARKLGMDEAVARFHTISRPEGIIANIDADCLCDPNYLHAIYEHFQQYPQSTGGIIHFEHPIHAPSEPIVLYELFLRYYIHALRHAGFPHADQTVGSSFAVRSQAYQQLGGMNKRKAGEDFYFLQKLFQTERYTRIHNTRVLPSPRPSDRVPFGTGRAILSLQEQTEPSYPTYNPQTFCDLKTWLAHVPDFFSITPAQLHTLESSWPPSIRAFLAQNDFSRQLQMAQESTTTPESFRKRFFRWFNAFYALKYVHFARDHHHPQLPVEEAASWLLHTLGHTTKPNTTPLQLLQTFRQLDLQLPITPHRH